LINSKDIAWNAHAITIRKERARQEAKLAVWEMRVEECKAGTEETIFVVKASSSISRVTRMGSAVNGAI
jgi:hypothetical protein